MDAPSDCVHFASQYPTSPSMCSPWATLADLPRSKDTPSNGEPWHLPCPRHAARKSTDSPPGPVRACTGPSTCGPTAWGRRWVVHGWPFAGVHWEPCTWSCEGGRGRSSFSCVVCSVCFRCRRRCRRRVVVVTQDPTHGPKNSSSATDNLTHCSGWSYSADKLLGQGKETCKRGWTGVEQGRREGLALCHYSCKMVALPS